MARTTCETCEQPVRGRRYCTPCELDRRYGQGISNNPTYTSTETNADSIPQTTELVKFECGECGHTFELESHTRRECPECGYNGLIGLGSRTVPAQDREIELGAGVV